MLFLLVITPIIYVFDKSFGCNYFFVNIPPEGTPLKWLASVSGIPGYLAGYAVLVMAVFCIVYFMDRIAFGKSTEHRYIIDSPIGPVPEETDREQ